MSINKNGMTTLNWIFVTIILALVQAFIWYAAFENASSSSALNYVSFSGTLVSIILAVLAIGYTYGESVSEKNKSDNLASQIEILKDVVQEVKIETKHLEKISSISEGVENTQKELYETNELIRGVVGLRKDNPKAKPLGLSASQVFDVLGRSGYEILDISLVFFCFLIKNKNISGVSDFIEEFTYVSKRIYGEEKTTSVAYIGVYFSQAYTLFSIFNSSSIFNKNESEVYELDSEFLKLVNDHIVNGKEFSQESHRNAIKFFKDKGGLF